MPSRSLAALLAVALIGPLAACGPSEPSEPTGAVEAPSGGPASQVAASPTLSAGHGHAEIPVAPGVALPAYGFYATPKSPAIEATPFVLTDQFGEPYRFDPAGDPEAITLLYFGYTNCPDVCPSELATVATAVRNLPDEISEQVRMVFVTVDPARDNVARMREYVELFDPSFVGLTGDAVSVRRAQAEHGLTPGRRLSEAENYAMSHAAEVLAFTADGKAHYRFPFGMTTIEWEHDLWKLIEYGWKGTGG